MSLDLQSWSVFSTNFPANFLPSGTDIPLSDCVACTAAKICTQCNPDFVDQLGQCSPCSANCDSCIDSNTCLTCSNVYTLNSNNTYLYNLVYPANRSMCASNITCATYKTGFFLALNWSCQACPISCGACSKPGVCIECADGPKFNLNNCKAAQRPHVCDVL